MTVDNLIRALADVIREETKDLVMLCTPTEGVCDQRPPDIHEYGLQKPNSWKKATPYVLVMPTGGATTQSSGKKRQATEGVHLVFTAYNGDSEADGLRAVTTLANRIRLAILKRPVIGGYFTINLSAAPFEWKIYLEGTEPYYVADADLIFNVPPVQVEVAEYL